MLHFLCLDLSLSFNHVYAYEFLVMLYSSGLPVISCLGGNIT